LPSVAVAAIEGLAVSAALRGESGRAIRLDAAACAIRRSRGVKARTSNLLRRQDALAAARRALTGDEVSAAERAGSDLTPARLVRYALRRDPASPA
jgi:hypothetical protein